MSHKSQPPAPSVKAKFAEIPLNLIDDPARPMRSDLGGESMQDLIRSIKQVGIIEPLVVRPVGERYEVIAGHRRTVAAEHAGLATAPCKVVEANDEEVEMLKIHENIYRLDVSPIDEANHFQYLIENHKLTPTAVAKLVNRGFKYVTDRLDILTYDEELVKALDSSTIPLGVARELNRIPELSKQRQYLSYAIKNGLTVGVAKRWVDDLMRPAMPQQQFTSETTDEIPFTPAADQITECFFCTQRVKLLEARVVYVHEECIEERQRILATETSEEPPSAAAAPAAPAAASGGLENDAG